MGYGDLELMSKYQIKKKVRENDNFSNSSLHSLLSFSLTFFLIWCLLINSKSPYSNPTSVRYSFNFLFHGFSTSPLTFVKTFFIRVLLLTNIPLTSVNFEFITLVVINEAPTSPLRVAFGAYPCAPTHCQCKR